MSGVVVPWWRFLRAAAKRPDVAFDLVGVTLLTAAALAPWRVSAATAHRPELLAALGIAAPYRPR